LCRVTRACASFNLRYLLISLSPSSRYFNTIFHVHTMFPIFPMSNNPLPPTWTNHRNDYLRVFPPPLHRLTMFVLVAPLSPSGHGCHDVVGDLSAGPHHQRFYQLLDAHEMPYCGTRRAPVTHALDSRTREHLHMMCRVPDSELSLDSPLIGHSNSHGQSYVPPSSQDLILWRPPPTSLKVIGIVVGGSLPK